MIIDKLKKIESRFEYLSIGNLGLFFIGLQVFTSLLIFTGLISQESLLLIPKKVIFEFELWRLITFVAVPPLIPTSGMGFIYLFISWYVFYIITLFLENHLGTFIFNAFFFSYLISIVLSAFLLDFSFSKSLVTVNSETFNYGLFFMVFLGFSVLNPNYEMLLFFILPLKVKFIAFLSLGFYILSLLSSNNVLDALIHLITLVIFSLFFSKDIAYFLNGSLSIKSKQNLHNDIAIVIHSCSLCNATSEKNPELEFRYRQVGEKLVCYCDKCRSS